eukprot:118310-Chlamydomonas_euryale.AAC.7
MSTGLDAARSSVSHSCCQLLLRCLNAAKGGSSWNIDGWFALGPYTGARRATDRGGAQHGPLGSGDVTRRAPSGPSAAAACAAARHGAPSCVTRGCALLRLVDTAATHPYVSQPHDAGAGARFARSAGAECTGTRVASGRMRMAAGRSRTA